MSEQLIAFHGSKAIKTKYLKRVRAHRKADELIRGTGWDGYSGCAVGCTLNKYEHAAYEEELGIPVVLAYLEDAISEGLPQEQAMDWPERFLSAVKPGAHLSLVSAHFMVWLLESELRPWATKESKAIVKLYKCRIQGVESPVSGWVAAARAAAPNARAARAAAYAAAVGAPYAAAVGAPYAAARAAEALAAVVGAAAVGASAKDAVVAAYVRMADKLIELLEAA